MLRIERKYLVQNHRIDALRKRISSFVVPDMYTHVNDQGIREYTVRSIYFDSNNFSCYAEKREGVMLRRKFRIRGYDRPEDNSYVVFEIKRKIEARQKKYRSKVLFRDVEELLRSGDYNRYVMPNGINSHDPDNAAKFLYHINKKQFVPTCLVVYEREAYFGKLDCGVRITFDKNIRSRLYPPVNSLYDEKEMKLLFKNHFILEIKYFRHEMPVWARSVVQEFRLRNDALSKYTIGVDANREKVLVTY